MLVPDVQSTVPAATATSFVDSGSVAIAPVGVCIVEVRLAGDVIGGAIIACGSGWAAILASGARAASPTPTFTVVGATVSIATAGATGATINVSARRLNATGTATNVDLRF